MAAYRWWVAGIWLISLVTSAVLLPTLDSRLEPPDYGVDRGDSTVAQGLVRANFPDHGDERDVVVFHAPARTVDDPVFQHQVEDVLSTIRSLPGVAGTVGPIDAAPNQISADRHTAFAIISLVGDPHARSRIARDVQLRIDEDSDRNGVRVAVTGYSPLAGDLTKAEDADLQRAESFGIPIAFIILVVALGGFVAALIPVISALASLLASFGMILLISYLVPFDSLVVTIATMIGTGVGIDYALFVVSRFREELARDGVNETARCAAIKHAVAIAVCTAGKTIVASGFIVIAALCSLVVIRAPIFREMATGVAITILCALAVGLTLLPATLAILGFHINRLALPSALQPSDARPNQDGGVDGMWAGWARHVMGRPILYAVAAVGTLCLMSFPITDMKYGIDMGTSSIATTPSGWAAQVLTEEFVPGYLSPIEMIATGGEDGPLNAAQLSRTNDLISELSRHQNINGVVTEEKNGRMLASLILSVPVDSTAATNLVTYLRDEARSIQEGGGPLIHVGGVTAGFVDLSQEITSKLSLVISLILAMSLALLVALFRSIVLPVKAVMMNLLSTVAALGVTVTVFQWGYGASPIHFTTTGFLQVYLPVMVFAVVFGLSMDYEIFLIGRIKEYWDLTANNVYSVAAGIEHTARPITAAAAIMVTIFGSFLTASVFELKQFGWALAAAVAIDAIIIRLVLVPALMRCLGRWNWWLPAGIRGRGPLHS